MTAWRYLNTICNMKRSPFSWLIDLLFPPRCVFCAGKPSEVFWELSSCTACLESLPDPGNCCRFCAYPLKNPEEPCPVCQDRHFSFTGACAVSLYGGVLKKNIHRFKYHGYKGLAKPFGRLMARQVIRSGWPHPSLVVPVPLHKKRVMERGYDQARLLASVVAGELGVPVSSALVRSRYTPSQTSLGVADRRKNVREAFLPAENVPVKGSVLLIDDILTTGATADAAATVLLEAGADEVFLAVIAR